MTTDNKMLVTKRDLADVMTIITRLWASINILAKELPPEALSLLSQEQAAARDIMMSVIERHDPQSVGFSEGTEGGLSVVLTMPFPPPPPKPPSAK
jgi:hypothetical protein